MSSQVGEGASERDRLLPAHEGDTTNPAAHVEEPADHHTGGQDDTAATDAVPPAWRTSALLPKLGASMFDFFTTGCAMAAVGIERHYDTSDGITAFIFPAGVVGYVCATASVEPICLRFGRRGIAVASPVLRLLSALLLASEPSFAVVLAAYACFGYGTGLTDTAWNTWASGLHRPNVLQGLLHGSFSLGCILGPALAAAVSHRYTWSSFYLIIALLSCVELITQGWAFRHETADKLQSSGSTPQADIGAAKLSSLLQHPAIWVCGAFYIAYQGVEATLTGWIVVFMLRARHATLNVASSASSIFWIGMALGRYALGIVTERFGVAKSVAVYITLALCSQVLLNLVTDIYVTLILLAASGFFVAPLFPSGIVLLVSRLQSRLHMPAVAFLIALGQIGAALATVAVGFMADALGIRHLFEVMCGLSALMLVLWIWFARAG